jgi:hypothetical protein
MAGAGKRFEVGNCGLQIQATQVRLLLRAAAKGVYMQNTSQNPKSQDIIIQLRGGIQGNHEVSKLNGQWQIREQLPRQRRMAKVSE